MKKVNFAFLRAIFALIAGLVLVSFPNEAGNYFVILIGALFLTPSLFSLLGYFAQHRQYPMYFPIGALGGALFGLLLMTIPGVFANFLTFVLGFFVLMGAVQQLSLLLAARSWSSVPLSYYFVPVLILLAGLYAVGNPGGTRATAFIIIGACCIVYAVFELVNWFKFTRKRPTKDELNNMKKINKDSEGIEDATIIE